MCLIITVLLYEQHTILFIHRKDMIQVNWTCKNKHDIVWNFVKERVSVKVSVKVRKEFAHQIV